MSIIKNLFLAPHAVAKHLDAPLLDEREQYLCHLKAGGRNRRQLQNVSGCLVGISRALEPKGLQPISRDEVRAAASKLATVPDGRFRQRSYVNYVGRAAGWLKHLNCLAEKSHPYRDCLREFQRTLSDDLKLSPSTVRTRYFRIARFLRWLSDSGVKLSEVTLQHADLYLKYLEAKGLTRSSFGIEIHSLRVFFRHAEQRNRCRQGIGLGILPIRQLLYVSDARGPSWEEVVRLLNSLNGPEPLDLRDRAMAILFAVYGLRCSELAGLLVTDIDFESEVMTVRRVKREGTQRFPLRSDVGAALRNYIAVGRPKCRLANVFVTLTTPYRRLSNGSLYNRVRGMFNRMKIVSANRGPHSLRHACANRLLHQGASLPEISAFLGHRRLQSVRHYIDYTVDDLRRVATLNVGGLV